MAGHDAIGDFDLTIKVAEDQDYVRRPARAGRYGLLRHPSIEIASRRFGQEDSFRMSLKWIGIELHRLIIGEIRGEYFRYFKQAQNKASPRVYPFHHQPGQCGLPLPREPCRPSPWRDPSQDFEHGRDAGRVLADGPVYEERAHGG